MMKIVEMICDTLIECTGIICVSAMIIMILYGIFKGD